MPGDDRRPAARSPRQTATLTTTQSSSGIFLDSGTIWQGKLGMFSEVPTTPRHVEGSDARPEIPLPSEGTDAATRAADSLARDMVENLLDDDNLQGDEVDASWSQFPVGGDDGPGMAPSPGSGSDDADRRGPGGRKRVRELVAVHEARIRRACQEEDTVSPGKAPRVRRGRMGR